MKIMGTCDALPNDLFQMMGTSDSNDLMEHPMDDNGWKNGTIWMIKWLQIHVKSCLWLYIAIMENPMNKMGDKKNTIKWTMPITSHWNGWQLGVPPFEWFWMESIWISEMMGNVMRNSLGLDAIFLEHAVTWRVFWKLLIYPVKINVQNIVAFSVPNPLDHPRPDHWSCFMIDCITSYNDIQCKSMWRPHDSCKFTRTQ